ncbi:Oidioi.mRNA.OKI2018_I69.XSR.g15484.t1.cds [Oikopleura dioica]|uniref:Oidioi.mRNA.OKI2018_I69.XSR.g15484.t1.cds n=1 Tax=Oikopleura dioica TaxID=34765 RepID=A0ABN7SD06_OIKDI|nr:Oidioi.mRNA.OKI2018_I69.XSR.g15484.t1.cds [Oikopleura dioica]
MEIYDEVKKNVSEAIAKISKYTEKDFKIRSQKSLMLRCLPGRNAGKERTKDGVTRRCTKEGLLDLGEIKQILDPMGNILGNIGGTVDLKEMKLWIPKKR